VDRASSRHRELLLKVKELAAIAMTVPTPSTPKTGLATPV